MSEGGHSFGPTCTYYEGDSTLPLTTDDNKTPRVKAQFFYVSSLPIDDPLSPLPAIQADKATDTRPQPFSIRDNAALEEAWQEFQQGAGGTKDKRRPISRGLNRMFSFPKFRSGFHTPDTASSTAESSSVRMTADTRSKRGARNPFAASAPDFTSLDSSSKPVPPKPLRRPSVRSNRSRTLSHPPPPTQVMLSQDSEQQEMKLVDGKELKSMESEHAILDTGSASPSFHRRSRDGSPISERSLPQAEGINPLSSQFTLSSDISGRPFARAPSYRQSTTVVTDERPKPEPESSPELHATQRKSTLPKTLPEVNERQSEKVYVSVGVSRLHLVEFPDLQMKPIYWSPINDSSSIIRATWFYKDTMLPVPADVANRLEIGYEDMKPYTNTYQDELNACIENGAAAELKVVHKLWPEESKSSRPGTSLDDKPEDQEMDATEEDYHLPDAFENAAADPRKPKKRRLWATYSVIYVNSRDAQIMRPSALPSVSKNRKPLGAVRKGRQIGIGVVRGFDRKLWCKLHPDPKTDLRATEAKIGAYMSQSGAAATRSQQPSCPKCDAEDEKTKVSDLVLVIHGIGQKLSERVDSFHFTHAINGLRREFNVELASETVRGTLRPETGIMVLPVNWRLTLKFDDDPKATESAAENKFGLKDITPETLPAIRSLISDVMLDIPYYMSHHKSKMIAAVVREANRVYRLWCKNNPGFQEYGRVHVVAHSLGSVMAMEILSNQPTIVPRDLDLVKSKPNEKNFEFDTTNLFCCGSPSGFFLLLNGGNLVPRKGRNKPGTQGEDFGRGVSSEAGRYGCLAVDNIYNICHRNDPIAYQQNACVDKDYAASIQPAFVPSATQSLFGRISNSLRWAGSSAHDAYGVVAPKGRPHVQHMPSAVELETHDFTREEIAEQRMYLLNDNGQIDYFLNSGGGPLEIQYLNMLGAHSSYWILQDFVRFLVVEIGRHPGRNNTLPALRAAKKREYKKGNLV